MYSATITRRYIAPQKHGDSNINHVASDRFPRPRDEEHFGLGQRNLDALLELVHGKASSIAVNHLPLDCTTCRDVIVARQHVHRARSASHCYPHPADVAAAADNNGE